MKYIIAFCVIYYYYYCFLGFDEGNKTYPVGEGHILKCWTNTYLHFSQHLNKAGFIIYYF